MCDDGGEGGRTTPEEGFVEQYMKYMIRQKIMKRFLQAMKVNGGAQR
jgi:hypothetical protein